MGFRVLQGAPCLCPPVRKSFTNSDRTLVSPFRFLLKLHGVVSNPGRTVGTTVWSPTTPQGPRMGPTFREGDLRTVLQYFR